MIVAQIPTTIPGSYRVEIDEVDDFEDATQQ
jgi:hypothetical protein